MVAPAGRARLEEALGLDPRVSDKTAVAFMYALRDWAYVAGQRSFLDPQKLPPLAGMAYVLFALWAEVSSEDVAFWIGESWEGRHIDMVEHGCRRIGAARTLDILARVRALFPNGFPTDPDEMQRTLQPLGRGDSALSRLSRELRPILEQEIPRGLHAFFSAHREQALAELEINSR